MANLLTLSPAPPQRRCRSYGYELNYVPQDLYVEARTTGGVFEGRAYSKGIKANRSYRWALV